MNTPSLSKAESLLQDWPEAINIINKIGLPPFEDLDKCNKWELDYVDTHSLGHELNSKMMAAQYEGEQLIKKYPPNSQSDLSRGIMRDQHLKLITEEISGLGARREPIDKEASSVLYALEMNREIYEQMKGVQDGNSEHGEETEGAAEETGENVSESEV